MKRLWCDISDIVAHARKAAGVSGMQRVQARLIGFLAAGRGAGSVRCVFARTRHGGVRQCAADTLFDEIDFQSGMFLARLGVRAAGDVYAHELRRYVRAGGGGAAGRLLRQLRVAWLKRTAPQRLESLGLTMPDPRQVRLVEVGLAGLLGPGDVLLLPGSTWAQPALMRFAARSRQRGCTVVSFIHDVLPATHPQFFTTGHARRFARFLAASPAFTSRFVCTSAATRAALQAILAAKACAAPIDVVPLAHEFLGFPRGDRTAVARPPVEQAVGDRGFVLCVGTIEVRKNGARLLRAWSSVLDALGPRAPRLVFAGRRGWKIEDFDAAWAADPRLRDAVGFVEAANDHDLAWLYERCLFTVFPSLAEGWGLPVGEAAWFGRFGIASSRTSIPEVGGPACDYVDPEDVAGLAAAIRRAIEEPGYRAEREREVAALDLRTWSDVAHDLEAVLAR
jgi:glycosyltransferase involved in cell wall biosynthesis